MRLTEKALACCLAHVNTEDMIVVTIHFFSVPPCVVCKTGAIVPTLKGY